VAVVYIGLGLVLFGVIQRRALQTGDVDFG